MKLLYPAIILLMGLTLISLMACHEQSAAISPSHKPEIHTKHDKPGAAIKLSSASIVSINANELIQVELLFDVKEPSGTLSFELVPVSGLDVPNTKMIQTVKLPVAAAIKVPVTLHAITNGRYYLHIHAGVDHDGALSTRNFALIVQVGPELEEPNKLKKMSGDKIISLPAQETISN